MISGEDKSWWAFSVDYEARVRGKVTENGVSPEAADEQQLLDYHGYLLLDTLLQSQAPITPVPDERAFIMAHQLIEMAFKLMIFDMAVIAQTLEALLNLAESFDQFVRLGTENEEFWLPALTASARLKFASKDVLTTLVGYLSKGDAREETFSSLEFQRFREYLRPASGFQTAQFRLIQRALGKANLLSIRMFHADVYWRTYENKQGGMVSVVDPLILGKQAEVASPQDEHGPLAPVARLDDLVHVVLCKFSLPGMPSASSIEEIDGDTVLHLIDIFQKIQERQQEKVSSSCAGADNHEQAACPSETFRAEVMRAVKQENQRRRTFQAARTGFSHLRSLAPEAYLLLIIERLMATDDNIHSFQDKGSFLSSHFQLTKDRLFDIESYEAQKGMSSPSGTTGGAGMTYLAFMRKMLIPLFPAVVACR